MSASASASRCFWPPDSLPYAVVALVPELQPLEQRVAVHRARVEAGEQPQRLAHRDLVGQIASPAGRRRCDPSAAWLSRPGIEAEHRHLAAVARPQPFEDFDGRGLAGAVRAEQAEHFAGKDLEVDAFDRLEACRSFWSGRDTWTDGVAMLVRALGLPAEQTCRRRRLSDVAGGSFPSRRHLLGSRREQGRSSSPAAAAASAPRPRGSPPSAATPSASTIAGTSAAAEAVVAEHCSAPAARRSPSAPTSRRADVVRLFETVDAQLGRLDGARQQRRHPRAADARRAHRRGAARPRLRHQRHAARSSARAKRCGACRPRTAAPAARSSTSRRGRRSSARRASTSTTRRRRRRSTR